MMLLLMLTVLMLPGWWQVSWQIAVALGGILSMSSTAIVIKLVAEKRDVRLKQQLEGDMHLVRCEDGRLDFRPTRNAAPTLAGDLQKKLTEAQIKEIEARTRAMQQGEGIIKIDGAGLQPHLEAIMWEMLKAIQVLSLIHI